MIDSDFIRMSVGELTTPKNGRICICNHWWAVTEANEALFYKSYSAPQCNTSRSIVDRVTIIPNTHAEFINSAFVPHNCYEYAP